MKILFFLEELLDDTNPNAKIGRLLADEWIKAGHEIVFLCNDQLADKKIGSQWVSDFNGIKTYRYKEPFTLFWKKLAESGESKLKAVLKQPKLILSYLDIMTGFRERTAHKLSKYIERIAASDKPDMIYAITEPYMTALAVAGADVKVEKRIYMCDPFSLAVNRNYDERSLKKARELERYVLGHVDAVAVTDIAKAQYLSDAEFCIFADKLSIVEFPNVRQIAVPDGCAADKYLVKDKINCVFAGRFYSDIRRPEFLLNTFELLNGDDVVLHIFGGGMEDVTAPFAERMKGRLFIHEFIPESDMMQVLAAADILVSLNNTAVNQVPSKIFEFFSLGKPVVNMCYLNDCPTLPYAGKYPLCENIFASDDVKVNADKLSDFIHASAGSTVEYDRVSEIFITSTPKFVADRLISIG